MSQGHSSIPKYLTSVGPNWPGLRRPLGTVDVLREAPITSLGEITVVKCLFQASGPPPSLPPTSPIDRPNQRLPSTTERTGVFIPLSCPLLTTPSPRAVSVPPPRHYHTTVLPSIDSHYSDFDCKVCLFLTHTCLPSTSLPD